MKEKYIAYYIHAGIVCWDAESPICDKGSYQSYEKIANDTYIV
jgi:hypothetical protein